MFGCGAWRWRPAGYVVAAAMLALRCVAAPSVDSATAEPSREAHRLVAASPAAAEALGALGLAALVVGVGRFVHWPVWTQPIARVGDDAVPNLERLLEVRANVWVTTASAAVVPLHERLRQLGIRVVALDTSTYEGTLQSLLQLGRLFSREAVAERLVQETRRDVAAVRARSQGSARRKVLVVVGQTPLYVAGPGSHLDEMVRAAGGDNVAGDMAAPYSMASLETVLQRGPDVIVDLSQHGAQVGYGQKLGMWKEFNFLPAVQQGQVFAVHPHRLAIAGPRLAEMTRLVGQMVHPELFGTVAPQGLGPLALGEEL